jgi:NAD(P)-dependent dehydrogenase (short-subunit alcohol dehydrogenase family)
MADFMSGQKRELPLAVSPATCAGKVYIVTGANSGLGFEAAQHLVAAEATKVILAVRNIPSGKDAVARIESKTGRLGVAEVWELDMASYDSIRAFVKRAESLERIDSIIENAGIILFQREESEGHLTTVTVNLLGTLLLAFLILPKISKEAKRNNSLAHISLVTSVAAFQGNEDWDKIKDDPIRKMDTEVEPVVKK